MRAWLERQMTSWAGTPCSVEEITGLGQVNRTYAVLGPKGRFVVRLRPGADPQAEYRKEAWCIQAAFRMGIPVPKAAIPARLAGVPVLIESLEPGVNGAQAQDALPIWRFLGWAAARLAQTPVMGYGPTLVEAGVFADPHSPTWADKIAYNLTQVGPRDPLAVCAAYAPEQAGLVRRALQRLARQPLPLGLCHGDLSPRNVLVCQQGMTLLDFGSAQVAPLPYQNLLDLPRQMEVVNAFCEGYGCDWASLEPILSGVRLLERLDKLRWALDHGVPIQPYVQLVREAVQDIQEM